MQLLVDVAPEPRTLEQIHQELYPREIADLSGKYVIKVHISHIRRKLLAAKVPLVIDSRRMFGYRVRQM